MTINDFAYFAFGFEGYKISDQAVKSSDSDVIYFGFLNKIGEWYIMEQDTSAGANSLQTFRYAKGASAYTTAWSGKEALSYGYINETFK